jgi:hypothetical protein
VTKKMTVIELFWHMWQIIATQADAMARSLEIFPCVDTTMVRGYVPPPRTPYHAKTNFMPWNRGRRIWAIGD